MQVKAERTTKPHAINACVHNWLVLIPYASKIERTAGPHDSNARVHIWLSLIHMQ